MQFDGGSQSGIGTGGFILAESDGTELVRGGADYGPGFTNNEAEAYSLRDALECLAQFRAQNPIFRVPVRIWGDG